MIVYTIGFTKKNAEVFFNLLKQNQVKMLIDTRISNNTQLAGYTKSADLSYFLRQLANIEYDYRPDLAPTKELLKRWRERAISWEEYEDEYLGLFENRQACQDFMTRYQKFDKVCLLCSEATPEHCHRRLLAEKLAKTFQNEIGIVHL